MADKEPKAEPSLNQQPAAEPVKMTEKDQKKQHREGGASYGYGYGRRARLSMFVLIVLLLAGITALTLWLVYRPHKPTFRVINVAVYELNITSLPLMYTTMQFTVVTRNPNRRASIAYDHLSMFVSYKNQVITLPTILPPLTHETKSSVALSPVLGGSAVPVSAEVVNGLTMDEASGVVGLRLVLTGKVRFKGALFRSGHNRIYVECNLFAGLKQGFVGQLPLLGSPPCRVDI